MRNRLRTVVVDADALIALFNKDDLHATTAMHLLERLTADNIRLLYPATTIAETVTTLRRRFNNAQAVAEVVRLVQAGHLIIAPVDMPVVVEALTLFQPKGSKQNTLFDAIVAAVAKQHHAEAIFSFDRWYEKQGLTLAMHLYASRAA